MYRRAATDVDEILKSRKPANSPVQQAMKFDLVINLDAAKQIGLTVPPWLLNAGGEGDQAIVSREK
jgi:putative ABC transport system substrate-binding protein